MNRPLGLHETAAESLENAGSGPRTVDDDVRRAWAAALAASIPAAPPAIPLAADAPASTAAWRPSDVSMTEMSDEVVRAGGRPTATASQPTIAIASRLETAVSTGALGKVSFVVDRSNAGLSIVVEVGSDAAAAAVDSERMTLLRTLRIAGLTVLSFRVLVRSGAGTGLAHRTGGANAKGGTKARSHYGAPAEGDDEENVDVVG
jgi:hypothetical protein